MNEFHNKIKKFQTRYFEIKDHIDNEEQTKSSLIIPFFESVLGWDMSNPLECKAEYTADLRGQNSNKVDYALMIDSKPVMLIEAKSLNENIDNYIHQLNYYFTSVFDCRIGILTNGRQYSFYTDLDTPNLMDSNSFFSFDLETLSDYDIQGLKQFCRTVFDVEYIYEQAEHIQHLDQAKTFLNQQMQHPSDELVTSFLTYTQFNGIKTQRIKEQYREYLKEAFIHLIDNKIYEKQDTTQKHCNSNQSLQERSPDITNLNKNRHYIVSNLTKNDIKQFTKTKVNMIHINNNIYEVNSWKDFLITVLNEVIHLKKFHFIQQNEKLYENLCPNQRKSKPIPLRKPHTLQNGIQVETNCSTINLLSKIQSIAKCCDINVQFTLK